MSLEKVQSGQPMRIKAQTFNSILDATRAYQERQQSGGRSSTREYSDSNIVLVKNDSGVDANRFDVLGIDEPIVLPAENLSEFENRVSFSCSTPSENVHEGKFVVLAEPIKAGKIGWAYAAGVAVAWVYMEYDGQVLTRVDIRDGQTKLYPAENGAATVLWYEPKTPGVWGDTRAIVRFGGSGAADIYVQITATEANGGVYSQWREVELVDDDGLSWSPVTDGLNGTDDGTLFEINGVEGVPENSVVKIFPNPSKDSDPDLPAWLFCYAESGNTGFGKPIAGEVDTPVTNPYIHLTVTDSAGVPILDDQGYEQQIKVWRNATRTNLYTRFDSDTVFTYVRFPQPVGGVGGCIFSRTEPIQRYDLYKPADGYSVSGHEGVTPSTDITGNPADEDHLHVRGMMYVEAGSRAFRPWFVIDPEKIVANGGKVKTDEDDTTAGYLDDEIIVLPDAGHNWITKTVTPGGENDNQLLLEHNDWDAENTTTIGSLISIEDAGPGITITPTGTLPPEGTAWFVFREYEDEYDAKNHSRLRAKEGGLKYFIIDIQSYATQVKTNFDDTTPGYLNDEIIVTPAAGYAWLTKTVTPSGENDNKLRLEHADWNAASTTTVGNLLAIQSAGDGVTITTVQPTEGAWFAFKEYEDEYDAKKHSKMRAKADTKYLAIEASNHKVKTNSDDSVPGYLNDEILVDPGDGTTYWLKKSIAPVPVVPDRKLLIEHDEWNSERGSSVAEPIMINSVGGGVSSVEEVTSEGYCWIKWDFYDVKRDDAGHMDVSVTGSLFSQWVAVPPGSNIGDMMYWNGVKWDIVSAGDDQSLLHVDGDTPGWFDKGDDESILLTRSGSLHWLPSALDQSLLYINGTQIDWFGNPSFESLLMNSESAEGLAWFPKGDDESICITRSGRFNWLSKGGEEAILYVSGGNLSWIPGPSSTTQVLGGDPGWTGDMQWITVVTDVQWNASAHRLEKKTRSVRVVDAGDESGWTAFATATEGCSL